MILDACDCVRDSKHTKRTCDFVKAIDGDSGKLNTSQHLSLTSTVGLTTILKKEQLDLRMKQ